MALQGKAILELAREKKVNNRIRREVVNRVEHKNDITALVDGIINEGNFFNAISASKILPIKQWFEGCLLTDIVNDKNIMMIAGNSNVVAQASNDAYTGTNTKRGSYNANESGLITNGWRNVFDWSTSQGNGTIASVCLCKAFVGAAEISNSLALEGGAPISEILGNASANSSALQNIQIIDYENEVGYEVNYTSGTITVNEYELNTKEYKLLGGVSDVIALKATHTISQTVNAFNSYTSSLSFTGSHIHILTWVRNSGTLYDYAINISNWSCTATTHTYSGVQFQDSASTLKDVLPIINGYIYAYASSGRKIVKCSLSNDADVTEYSNPLYAIEGLTDAEYNGGSVILPNGDWYKFPREINQQATNASCLYSHNGQFYVARTVSQTYYGAYQNYGMMSTNYGTILHRNRGGNFGYSIQALYPYVSTVANLEEAVTKSADLTMKLTYEITEASA